MTVDGPSLPDGRRRYLQRRLADLTSAELASLRAQATLDQYPPRPPTIEYRDWDLLVTTHGMPTINRDIRELCDELLVQRGET